MRQRNAGLFLTVSCAVGLAGCDDGSSATDQVPTAAWTLSTDPDLRIGHMDGPADYLFDRVSAAVLLDDGGLVVADAGSVDIRVFDEAGDLVARFGQEGEGPGEFGWLGSLEVRGDTIFAYDPALMRISLFEIGGAVLTTRQIDTSGGAPEVFAGVLSNGDIVAGAIRAISRDPSEAIADEWAIGRYDHSGMLQAHLGQARGYVRLQGRPVPFSPRPHVSVDADSLLVADAASSTVSVFDMDGRLVRSFDLDLPHVSAAEAREELEATIQGMGEENRFFDEVVDAAWQEEVPSFAGVIVDSTGRIWVKHYSPATDSWLVGGLTEVRGGRWSIFDRDGGHVAEIELPGNMVPMDVSRGRLVGVERDALGVERVVVYAVEQ